MTRILVLDCETGGKDSRTCGLTEIGAVVFEHDDWRNYEFVAGWHSLIQESPDLLYEDEALSVQRRTLDDLSSGLPERDVLLGLTKFIGEVMGTNFYQISPWAHNQSFDLAFLMAAYGRHALAAPFNRGFRCSVQLYRIARDLGLHNDYRSDLGSVVRTLRLGDGDQHHAYDDAMFAGKAIGFLMGQIRGLKAEVPNSCADPVLCSKDL